MSKRAQASTGRLWPLVAVPLLIVGIGLGIAHFDAFSGFRDYAGSDILPESLVQSGRTGRQLRLLDYMPLSGVRLENFDATLHPDEMPSTSLMDSRIRQSSLPTISVALDSKYLLDRHTGLLNNYEKRGRSWERPAYASYFRDGRLAWATGVGLRMHGGKSRAMDAKSFRLYFRDLYGNPELQRDRVFDGADSPMDTLIIHNDLRIKDSAGGNENWHYVNPIAYAIARRIGCIVPATQPVRFYLNGKNQGPYVLTEHITIDFLVARFGHDDFFLADTKSDDRTTPLRQGSQRELRELIEWPQEASAPLTIAQVEEKVDLDNLTNWFISILYTGTTDPFQGAVARDRSRDDSRWFWINWDMDHSFMDLYSQEPNAWEVDNFTGVTGFDNYPHPDPRKVLFNRLRAESPEYRVYFLTRLVEVLNHELTPEFLDLLLDEYERIAATFGIEDRKFLQRLRQFVAHRPAVLRDQMNTYFSAGPSYTLTIKNDDSLGIKVDGHDIGTRYTGWYFAATPSSIEIDSGENAEHVVWMLDGEARKPGTTKFDMKLATDTVLEVRRKSAHSQAANVD